VSEQDVDWEQKTIEASNRRSMWQEIETCLKNAKEAVEWAQGCFDDLDEEGSEGYADRLQPIVDQLRAAWLDAAQHAGTT
jgi:hypothetical protein